MTQARSDYGKTVAVKINRRWIFGKMHLELEIRRGVPGER